MEEEQHKERERLFAILEDLVIWENSNNQDVLEAAKKEILKYNQGKFPTLLEQQVFDGIQHYERCA